MRQVGFAVPGRESRPPSPQHPRDAGANSQPSPLVLRPFSWIIVLLSSYGGNVYALPPFSPVASSPESVSSLLVQGVPEDAGRKIKMPPSPEALKQMTINSTLAPSEHYRSP